MKRALLLGFAVVVVLAVIGLGISYWTGWNTARTAATAIATGQSPSPSFQADPEYYDRLGRPGPHELSVRTVMDESFGSPGRFQVNFVLSNLRDDRIPMINLGVSVQLGLRGWEVIGFGSGG